MAFVKNILDQKGKDIWSVSPDTSVKEALQLMANKKIGALMVIENGKIIGIFSERDYARQTAKTGDLILGVPVRALMSRPVFYVNPDQSVEECMTLMTAKHIRHLPVMENEQLVGVISIGDVVKQIINEKDTTIKVLESYITGRGVGL